MLHHYFSSSTKPSTDDEEVTDGFNIRFNNDDMEAILDGFVEVISILPAEFGVPT